MNETRSALAVALVVLGVALLLPILAMGVMGPWMMGPWTGTGDGWALGAPAVDLAVALLGLLPLAALFALGYLLIRTTGDDGDPAREELRRAYARGDLTDEEFERRRERLEVDREGR